MAASLKRPVYLSNIYDVELSCWIYKRGGYPEDRYNAGLRPISIGGIQLGAALIQPVLSIPPYLRSYREASPY